VAFVDKVAGHRQPHVTEPDETYLRHGSILPRNASDPDLVASQPFVYPSDGHCGYRQGSRAASMAAGA
jgi:hypothetical protein